MKLLTKQPIWTIALLTSSIFIYSCGDDDTPPAPKDTTPPIVTIDNIQVFANESDNNPNDASFYVATTDNKDANPTTTVTVDNKKVTVGNDGNYFVANLQPGTHTIKAQSTDKAGNETIAEAAFSIEADTQAPTVAIENFKIVNADGDATGYKNDIEFTVNANDNQTVKTVTVALDGKVLQGNGNTYKANNLSEGTHELKVTAEDDNHNKTETKKTFTIEAPTPTVSYKLELEPAQNTPVNEETDGKISTIPFKAEKTTTVGNKTETVPAKNVEVALSGADANRLTAQIVNNKIEVSIKPGQGKDHEDADGNDTAEGKAYTGTVTVKILDKNGKVVAEKAADITVENKDMDDYTPTFEGKKLTIDGKVIVVEKDGKLAKDYVDGKALFNAENKEAMNSADVENVIEGGKKRFKKYVSSEGYGTFPEFKDGSHQGKLVGVEGTLKPLSYAMGEVDAQNYPKLGSEVVVPMQKMMGKILAELPPEAWSISSENEGVTFMSPKAEYMAELAGLIAFKTFEKYDPKDYQ